MKTRQKTKQKRGGRLHAATAVCGPLKKSFHRGPQGCRGVALAIWLAAWRTARHGRTRVKRAGALRSQMARGR